MLDGILLLTGAQRSFRLLERLLRLAQFHGRAARHLAVGSGALIAGVGVVERGVAGRCGSACGEREGYGCG